MNLIDKAKNYAKGVEILSDWVGRDGLVCDTEEAQRRTDTCLKCPMNRSGSVIVESVARAIKEQMQFKNSLGLRTMGIKSLHSCSACDCYLPLKIWVPKDVLMNSEDADSLSRYHESCWMLK